jgi:hypothetical protein
LVWLLIGETPFVGADMNRWDMHDSFAQACCAALSVEHCARACLSRGACPVPQAAFEIMNLTRARTIAIRQENSGQLDSAKIAATVAFLRTAPLNVRELRFNGYLG